MRYNGTNQLANNHSLSTVYYLLVCRRVPFRNLDQVQMRRLHSVLPMFSQLYWGYPYRFQRSMHLEIKGKIYFRDAEFKMTAQAATTMNSEEPGYVKVIPKRNECHQSSKREYMITFIFKKLNYFSKRLNIFKAKIFNTSIQFGNIGTTINFF